MASREPPLKTTTEGFDLTALLGFRVFRLSVALAALAEADSQRVAGLTVPEYRCVVALATRATLGVVELCQLTQIDRAWISRTLAKLVEKALVCTEPDPYDGRRVKAALTSHGVRVAQRLIAASLQRQTATLGGFSAEESARFFDLLDRVQQNADMLASDGLEVPPGKLSGARPAKAIAPRRETVVTRSTARRRVG